MASSSSSQVETCIDSVTKAIKRQRTAESKTDECLDALIAMVSQARDQLAGDCMDPEAVVGSLGKSATSGPLKDLLGTTKDLHSAINKLSKDLDKLFDPDRLWGDGTPDVCLVLRDVGMDASTLSQVIAEHLYREGRFSLADVFAHEAGISNAAELKQPYVDMHVILEKLKARDLGPALAWAVAHRAGLSPDAQPSAFEFRIHALAFLSALHDQGHAAALAYAQAHFSAFQSRHMRDIQRLMGCLVYAGRPLGQRLYADLLSPGAWDDLAHEFVKQACSLMGQAAESPLAVSVAAGCAALPALLKLAVRMREGNLPGDLKTCEQLPIELELGSEFLFHSIFACPVARDQSSVDNPPMLLPCNHVICEQSLQKIAKGSRTRTFKCPYCPMEARLDSLPRVVFPETE